MTLFTDLPILFLYNLETANIQSLELVHSISYLLQYNFSVAETCCIFINSYFILFFTSMWEIQFLCNGELLISNSDIILVFRHWMNGSRKYRIWNPFLKKSILVCQLLLLYTDEYVNGQQGPLLLTWINFNPNMNTKSHTQSSVGLNHLSITKLQWLHR